MAGLRADTELRLRTLSGIGIVAVILWGINTGGLVWAVIAGIIALVSLGEYYRLAGKIRGARISPGMGYIFSLVFLLVATGNNPQPVVLGMILSLCVLCVMSVEVFRRQMSAGNSRAVMNSGAVISGVLYITVPWTCMVMLRDYAFGRQVLDTLFFCTWGCDVGAYIGGKMFGTTKLCEHVSPGKTLQGFIAGIIGSLLANAGAIYFFSLPSYPLILIGFICGIFGQLGDLAESLIKREAGEKDSGHVIPGHGGMLDRFDSILFSGLLTYLVLRVIL
ncbi:MAG: phosphatidate cytidylyltransferase [Synergistaceae bacterium]|nr:phosphatidate cytidylyltransferase [Synergistaceae bacterium]MBQ7168786.1 phosphatidate cytidylyltransferase [Synergistaceae bacterium]